MEQTIRTLACLNSHSFVAKLDEVRLRNGRISDRIKIDHPQAVAVIPLVDPEHVLMVKQYRYALGFETWEIPAGKMDQGEDELTCGQRELMEETGYQAAKLTHLLSYYPAIGYSDEIIHIYLAPQVIKSVDQVDEDEISAVEVVALSKIKDMIRRGEIMDGKTILGISLLSGALD
ncbi:MAG: NUDIX hydrolase [Deltaproteobacteria bacterium]|nr:NUDIX hydrolase [Deltaproteobacteria bacterium]MBF0526363.1 NUDIX hydrolase [Deltaproteobacteria bacterium]